MAVEAMVEAGLLEMVKRVLEPGLQAELTDHLGYESHDPAGVGQLSERVHTETAWPEVGDIDVTTPQGPDSTVAPQLVGKDQRRLDGLSDMIISLMRRG